MNIFVPPTGPRSSKIAFIGEAPGRQELLNKPPMPFVGASGRLHWSLIKPSGLDRSNVYCTNVIKISAPSNPLKSLWGLELDKWQRSVRAELDLCEANIYVAYGATALWALADIDYGITNWRGSILHAYNGRKMIATFHPANILRTPSNLPMLKRDLQQAIAHSMTPDFVEEPEEYVIFPTISDCLQHLNAARKSGEFAFDIETAPGGIVTCISFAYGDSHTSICIPMHGIDYWKTDEFFVIYKALKATLGDPHVNKIGQNVSYDIIGLKACGIEVVPPIEDIMHMHHAIDPLSPHSLAFQASMYTNKRFWKEWDVAPEMPLANKLDEHFDYNCRDSDGTLELSRTYKRRFPQVLNFYEERYKNVLPHLLQMYEDGLCIDDPLRVKLARELRSTASKLSHVISSGLGVDKFNPNSFKQLNHVLYDILDLPKQFRLRNRKRVLTSDDEALVDLYLLTQNHYVLGIRDVKEQYKLASFLDPRSPDAQAKRKTWDGRLRCEYKLNRSDNDGGTGRLSSSASLATKIGINLQQIPPYVRQIVIPAPGYVFLEPDYAQAEARVIAWDSIDLDMMHFFELARIDPKTYDIHWHNATLILEQPRTNLTPDDRNCCKHIVYGSFYDMREQKLQKTVLKYTNPPIYIELSECKRRQDVFKSKVPKFQERQERIRHEVLTTGKQVSPSGRVVTYHDVIVGDLKYCFGHRDTNETLRSAYSMIPQDIIALLINRALRAIDIRLREAKLGRVCMQVHDSLLLEILDDKDSIERSYLITKEEMERGFVIRNNSMIIPADFKLGYHWPCGQKDCKVEAKDIRTLDQLLLAYERIKN
jgi:uracil-DNA glycosylase family 4